MSLLTRRMMMIQGGDNVFEPYYSDYPELTEPGLYVLTPDTTDGSNVNTFVMIGDNAYEKVYTNWAKQSYSIIISEEVTKVYRGNVLELNAFDLGGMRFNAGKLPVKIKRCAGTESDPPLVTFYVQKIF